MRFRKLSKTGHAQIDAEHNELIYMLNNLSVIVSRRTQDELILKLFNSLIKSAEYHIKNEEKLMSLSNYPDIEQHKRDHLVILEELKFLKSKLEKEILDFQMKFAICNKNWLKHLYKDDKPLVKYLKKKG